MKSIVLGTAGHVDHGKTALVEALTGVNTDRWEEERERGITIDLGFAPLPSESDGTGISIVDVPGHEDFVKNMLAGASGVDVLLLVVAADEGPMPQTREHLWIARLLGVHRGVAAVSKCDLVDDEWQTLVQESTAEEIRRVFEGEDWPILPVSASTGQGLADLRTALLAAATAARPRPDDDLFRMPLDRVFSVRGFGTVVTGTVWSGRVEPGSRLRLLPDDRAVRVRGIQVHGQDVAGAGAGQRAALSLVGVDRSEVKRGHVLTDQASWRETRCLDAALYLLPDSPWPLRHWQRVRVHLGTSETMARVVLFAGERLEPGERAIVQLRTERPVVARGGDRFVVRFYSPVTTVGGGSVLDPWADRRSRLDEDQLSMLEGGLGSENPDKRLRSLLRGAHDGVAEEDLPVRLGIAPAALRRQLTALAAQGAVLELGDRWYPEGAIDAARSEILTLLEQAHARDPDAQGVSLESIRSVTRRPAPLVDHALADLEGQGALRLHGSLAALTHHVPRLSVEQQALAEAARVRLAREGFAPPTVRELADVLRLPEDRLLPVLKFLARRGDVVPVTPDLYYDSGAIIRVMERVGKALRAGGAATPSEMREVLGVSRKYVIPLLEHLDATGFTRRTAHGRVLRKGE